MPLSVQENRQGLLLKVFIQPRSSKNMVAGLHGDALKIKLTAPPVDGAANIMCIAYLAQCLGLPKSSIEIVSGQKSRTKRVLFRYADGKVAKTESKRLKHLIQSLLGSSKIA